MVSVFKHTDFDSKKLAFQTSSGNGFSLAQPFNIQSIPAGPGVVCPAVHMFECRYRLYVYIYIYTCVFFS